MYIYTSILPDKKIQRNLIFCCFLDHDVYLFGACSGRTLVFTEKLSQRWD